MSDNEKKQKSGIVGILSGLGGLCAGLGALWSATTSNTQNELMIKSVYEVTTVSIPKIGERVAVLEATCIRVHMEKIMDEMSSHESFECQSDGDCDIGNTCMEEKCIIEEHKILMPAAELVSKKPDFNIPKFEDIKKHVQQTGKVWSNNVAAIREEGHELPTD